MTEKDSLPLGYLRTFVTLLVLAHHALLAYHPFAPPQAASLQPEPRWWQAFPVLDSERFTGFALLVGWNDIFFMSLFFLLSGLFVAGSVGRRGVADFVGTRLRRLGIPFLFLAGVVAPLAYYPTYLLTESPAGIAGYAREWLALGTWPSGPAWFLWLLLAFDVLVAGSFVLLPGWPGALSRRLTSVFERPLLAFSLLIALSAACYLPLTLRFGPLHWTLVGPFAFQTSRLAHYALYFTVGVLIGAYGLGRGLLSSEGRLARGWPVWTAVATMAFGVTTAAVVASFAPGAASHWALLGSVGFVVTCATSCFALLGLFLRRVAKRTDALDSLRANAYGMYVVHYAFASWLVYLALPWPLPALFKGVLAVGATVLLSWAASAALRRIPAVARVL